MSLLQKQGVSPLCRDGLRRTEQPDTRLNGFSGQSPPRAAQRVRNGSGADETRAVHCAIRSIEPAGCVRRAVEPISRGSASDVSS
jgi:hypothetical protein